MEGLLHSLVLQNRELTKEGKLADYIPELANANAQDLGVFITACNNKTYGSGDVDVRFTLQSISKIITLACVLEDSGRASIYEKTGVEPTSDPFNSIKNLETKNFHKPLNPMINSGAIATVSMLKGDSAAEKYNRVASLLMLLTDSDHIIVNKEVYVSEKKSASRNRALAHYMKSTGIIDGDVEEILDLYFRFCSIESTCMSVSRIASVLANDGVLPWNNMRVISAENAKMIKAIMTTCGMYDASGEFSVEVGIPAKSGVSGGIMAVVPGRMGIGVIGPALDKKGNSVAGVSLLKELSKALSLSIF